MGGGTALAWTTSITDTSGYVVQTATDGAGKSSIINGDNFPGGAPVAGKDYLVTGGLNTRSPATRNASNEFKGDSLTLDGGAALILKGSGSTLTVNDLRVHNAKIWQGDGNTQKYLQGTLTVYGTADAPTIIQGSGSGGDRYVGVRSALVGSSTACLRIAHTEGETDGSNCEFYAVFSGNGSAYEGEIEVDGSGGAVNLVATETTATRFGANPRMTLRNGGGLLGMSGRLAVSGATITVDGGARFGSYKRDGDAMLIGGGTTIAGTGILRIDNPQPFDEDVTYAGAVVMTDVSISGIDEIRVERGQLRLGNGYDNPAIPVVLTGSARLLDFGKVVTIGSLTVSGNSAISTYLRAGCLNCTGNLTKGTTSGKIMIDLADDLIRPLGETNVYRILSAPNLGVSGGLSADDFTVTADSATLTVGTTITGGTLSIESENGTNYLAYTLPKKIVSMNGGKDGTSSFLVGDRWSDNAVPHDDAAYVLANGAVLRAPDGTAGAFPDTPLLVTDGTSFYVQGATVTVNDLRLFGGGIVLPSRNSKNVLAGAITVYGSATKPFYMETEGTSRPLTISSAVGGEGSVMFRYRTTSVPKDGSADVFYLTGDNSGFAGEWQVAHWAVRASFKDAAAIGGASSLHFFSNGVFWAESSCTIPAGTGVNVDDSGRDESDPDKTNGGTFMVEDGVALTVAGDVSGNGILRKTGTGVLCLTADNALTGQADVRAGRLLVDGSLTNGTANVVVRPNAFVGGTGKVKAVELESGAGLAVTLGQSEPLDVGTLTLDGGVTVDVSVSGGSSGDIANMTVVRYATLDGTPDLASSAIRVNGVRTKGLRLQTKDSSLCIVSSGFIISFR